MKKASLFTLILGSICLMTSCQKTYTCTCTDGGSIGSTYTFKAKKGDAEAICAAEEGYAYGSYLTCSL